MRSLFKASHSNEYCIKIQPRFFVLAMASHLTPNFPEPLSLVSASPATVLVGVASVRAGFPSPAEGTAVSRLDISKILVQHDQATFLLRVAGDSMRDFGINDRDLILVDRAIRPGHGMVVVAELDGDYTLKRLFKSGGVVKLQAGNDNYPDIYPRDGQTLSIFGVVTWSMTKFGP